VTDIIAHRGGALLWPENSRAACRGAIALGVDEIQLDVHSLGDGGVAVIHDPLFDRTTDRRGPVGTVTTDVLASVRLDGSDTETVPELAEMIDIIRPTAVMLRLELKRDTSARRYPRLHERLAEMLLQTDMQHRTVISSFALDDLLDCKERVPAKAYVWLLSTAFLAANTPDEALAAALRHGVSGLGLRWHMLTPGFAKAVREFGMTLDLFGCDDVDAIAAALGARPDGLMTDRPDIACDAVRDAYRSG
jgi:glycerophosphoryl diester phosphodiesterase